MLEDIVIREKNYCDYTEKRKGGWGPRFFFARRHGGAVAIQHGRAGTGLGATGPDHANQESEHDLSSCQNLCVWEQTGYGFRRIASPLTRTNLRNPYSANDKVFSELRERDRNQLFSELRDLYFLGGIFLRRRSSCLHFHVRRDHGRPFLRNETDVSQRDVLQLRFTRQQGDQWRRQFFCEDLDGFCILDVVHVGEDHFYRTHHHGRVRVRQPSGHAIHDLLGVTLGVARRVSGAKYYVAMVNPNPNYAPRSTVLIILPPEIDDQSQ